VSPELEEQLVKDYPVLFSGRNAPLTESLMAFGCECDDGWFTLIKRMCECIDRHVKDHWKYATPYRFVQIKEKFGGLCVYDHGHDDTILGIIEMTEAMSYSICEACGHPGQLCSTGYWVRTLCSACAEKNGYRPRMPDDEV